MTLQLVNALDVPPQAWRNGGGRTRELLIWPAGGDDWSLRISLADIEEDGPFSAFPGVTRWFAVVDGAGVVLQLPNGEHRLTRDSAPVQFDGAVAPACRLIAGPTRDLNLMVRRGSGAMSPVTAGVVWDAPFAQRGLLCVRGGSWHDAHGQAVPVPPLTLLWHRADTPCRFEPTADPDVHAATGPSGWWIGFTPQEGA